MVRTHTQDSAPAATSESLTPASTSTPSSQYAHLHTITIDATDSQDVEAIVAPELLPDAECTQRDDYGVGHGHLKNLMQVRTVADSSSRNDFSLAETLRTYSPVPVPENNVLSVPYTHVMGPFTMDNCVELNCELPSSKEYWREPL